MAITLTSLARLPELPFDDIIDVRSPSEFAEDHLPGAINLPVFSDEERARVGTIYVRQNRFLARKIGAAILARNAAAHLEGPLADRDGGWRPLVYCWRGGQRSGGFASILEQIGWRADRIEGGYKSYRRLVVETLYDRPLPHRVVLIAGGTGTGKTQLLHHLRAAGGQSLDLEALACHRGSLFGGDPNLQPAQKTFESRIACQMSAFDPARPVFIEAESGKIGRLILPPSLRDAMRAAPVIEVQAPMQARARYLTGLYGAEWAGSDRLRNTLDALRPYHAADRVAHWHELARAGRLEALVADLIALHYDPRYARPIAPGDVPLATIGLDDLAEADLVRAADRILDLMPA